MSFRKTVIVGVGVVSLIVLSACMTQTSIKDDAPVVTASVETAPVASLDDAADDPAIWIHPSKPEKSLILGTDKQAGLYAYNFSGEVVKFLDTGRFNNVDLRQGVTIGDWTGDLAAASNRSNDTLTLFAVDETGPAAFGAFPSLEAEPYGACMGVSDGVAYAFAAHKSGKLLMYRVNAPDQAALEGVFAFSSQLEGCVHDDAASVLYVGEENVGVWRVTTSNAKLGEPQLVDGIGGPSGVAADVEGLALYQISDEGGYLIASSQGNDSYAVYERSGDNRFLGRFRIGDGVVDGAEETDGLEATAVALGADYPRGVLVVQDGYNRPGNQAQNYKIVDWREIEAALSLE